MQGNIYCVNICVRVFFWCCGGVCGLHIGFVFVKGGFYMHKFGLILLALKAIASLHMLSDENET